MTTPTVGQVVKIAEADYKYGEGELTFRITFVGRPFAEQGTTWIALKGKQWLGRGYGPERVIGARLAGIMPVADPPDAP